MPPLVFEKVLIADERYESAGVFDVNNNGHLDIVSGAWWYPGPTFDRKCPVGDVAAEGEYYDDFSTIPMDVNGDGQLEILPNTPGEPQRIFKLITDPDGRGTGEFREFVISEGRSGHGLGCGDITGNGRMDIVLINGWLEQSEEGLAGKWTFHEEFDLARAGVPILVVDVNGDGVNELIVGGGHGYGLDWYEQRVDGGKRTWIRHPIDPENSQYHDLIWADIDGDGACELITGKRYRAHCGKDPGADDPVGLYYFKWTGEGFAKQVIDYGPPRVGTGCGIHFQVIDTNGDGRLDIVAPGKDGLYLFRNLGPATSKGG